MIKSPKGAKIYDKVTKGSLPKDTQEQPSSLADSINAPVCVRHQALPGALRHEHDAVPAPKDGLIITSAASFGPHLKTIIGVVLVIPKHAWSIIVKANGVLG